MFSRMSTSSAVRDRRIGVPFAAESIKSNSQLHRESIGDGAMMVSHYCKVRVIYDFYIYLTSGNYCFQKSFRAV